MEEAKRGHFIDGLKIGENYSISMSVKLADKICEEALQENNKRNLTCSLDTITKFASTDCEHITGPNKMITQGNTEDGNPFYEVKSVYETFE